MELQPIVPEFLHKDELPYELEIRGINTEGYNVADLRSIFRKSRDVKENVAACTNSDIFLAPDKAGAFCVECFQQIKELVENTDLSSVGTVPIFLGISTGCVISALAYVIYCSLANSRQTYALIQ
jgi:hypothetical protein